jgi:hypothetical protein
MARIYISSTYSDLKEYRDKVYHKLRELQHDVVAFAQMVSVSTVAHLTSVESAALTPTLSQRLEINTTFPG